ncbi:MAG TPA: SRPBCC family protein [Solirubrobacteraceae bacterium]|nr:SRPBCC family protein [Solirubrobacteraceae bacterium]
MASDVSDLIGTAIGRAAREAAQGLSGGRRQASRGTSGGKALAAATLAGAGLAAAAPAARRGLSKLVSGLDHPIESAKEAGTEKLHGAGEKLKGEVADEVKGAVPGAGLLSKLGGGSDDEGSGSGSGSKGAPGVGKGRRMPVQQDIDIGVPLSTVYNEWTQFENWPQFMHRLTSASQQDETHVAFKTKIWGKTKEFTAEIVEQRPDERIKWRVVEGVSHTGVVTFHELGPRLTRVEVNLDVEPGSMIEKAARGMRYVKRAVRADLARFKAHVLMEEEESGEWRGMVEDGEVKSERSSSSSRGGASTRNRSSSRSRASSSNGHSGGGSGSSSGGSRSGSRSSSGRSRSASGSSSGRSRSGASRSRGSSNGSSASGSRSSGSRS